MSSFLQRRYKSRASDLEWQRREYEKNMKIKRGELVWSLEVNDYVEPVKDETEDEDS